MEIGIHIHRLVDRLMYRKSEMERGSKIKLHSMYRKSEMERGSKIKLHSMLGKSIS